MAFSGQHTALSVKHRAFLSQTGLSEVCKGLFKTNTGPLKPLRGPLEARKGYLRPTKCYLGQMECLDRLIEGPYRVTMCPPRRKQGPLGPKLGLTRPVKAFSWHHRTFISKTQTCRSLRSEKDTRQASLGPPQADTKSLRAAQSLVIPTECPLGPKDAFLDQKEALS